MATALSPWASKPAPVTILLNATVVDVEKRQLLKDHQVRIRNGRIDKVCATSAGSLQIDEPDAKVSDLQGRYVIPGLIDCHVHLMAA